MSPLDIILALATALWVALGATLPPPPPPPPVPMSRLDHPRCFPPGTEGTQAFELCPDNLPKERST